MKMKKNRGAALILSAVLAICQLFQTAPVTAFGDEGTIEIGSVKELKELSKESVFDTYSRGKVFELTADIDLTGSGFLPIASFSGTFRGNGHVISGLYCGEEGSDVGLFRFVEPEGVVENLTVSVMLHPQGSKSNVGGIVGTNRGRISGCRVVGEIRGKENIGGIAGYNEAGGLIEDCVVQAVVSGLNATGGICGRNEGIIEDCKNQGEINTTEQKEDGEGMNLSLSGNLLDAEKVYHTGGIAGRNTGVIRGCVNEASVGYLHAGYNTGGIAGLQNGGIYQCVNKGTILGRKDTGGIVGQFEPYIRIRYEEDTIQKLQNQVDVLLDQLEGLGDVAESAGADTRDSIDLLRGDWKGIRSQLQSDKQYYSDSTKDFSEELDDSLGDLEGTIDDFEIRLRKGNVSGGTKKLKADMERIKELRVQLKEAFSSDLGQVKPILEEMSDLLFEMDQLAKGLPEDVVDDMGDTVSGIRSQVDDIRYSAKDARNLIQIHLDQLLLDVEDTGDELDGRMDQVSDNLDTLLDRLETAGDEAKGQTEAIRAQLRAIKETVDNRYEELEEDDDKKLIDDVSETEEEPGNGMVMDSINEGRVESDNNVGGIVGIIAMELTLDPENDVDIEGEVSLKISRTARAAVKGCTNRMDVVSTNDYAGGIAGRADAGALRGNYNYGDVEATNGGCVGGIAGSSIGAAKDNFVLCQLTGKDYVGGIVGKGEDVTGNYAMASILSESGEYHGAVAGYADGQVENNHFVWEGLAAVNGVTYQSQAQAMTYEELTAMAQVPDEFRSFVVEFLADGNTVASVTVPYLQPVPEEEIPTIPEKPGYYAYWEDKGQSKVTRNIRVNAQYRLWTTTVSAWEEKDGLPLMLAEGNFYPGTKLTVEETEITPQMQVNGYTPKRAYAYSLTSPVDQSFENMKLRTYVGDISHKRQLRAAAEMGGFTLCAGEEDGSYLLIEASQTEGVIVILEKNVNWYPAAVLAALTVLLAVALLVNKRKKNKAASNQSDRETSKQSDREESEGEISESEIGERDNDNRDNDNRE